MSFHAAVQNGGQGRGCTDYPSLIKRMLANPELHDGEMARWFFIPYALRVCDPFGVMDKIDRHCARVSVCAFSPDCSSLKVVEPVRIALIAASRLWVGKRFTVSQRGQSPKIGANGEICTLVRVIKPCLFGREVHDSYATFAKWCVNRV